MKNFKISPELKKSGMYLLVGIIAMTAIGIASSSMNTEWILIMTKILVLAVCIRVFSILDSRYNKTLTQVRNDYIKALDDKKNLSKFFDELSYAHANLLSENSSLTKKWSSLALKVNKLRSWDVKYLVKDSNILRYEVADAPTQFIAMAIARIEIVNSVNILSCQPKQQYSDENKN